MTTTAPVAIAGLRLRVSINETTESDDLKTALIAVYDENGSQVTDRLPCRFRQDGEGFVNVDDVYIDGISEVDPVVVSSLAIWHRDVYRRLPLDQPKSIWSNDRLVFKAGMMRVDNL